MTAAPWDEAREKGAENRLPGWQGEFSRHSPNGVRNALTIDVEEWFHVSLFRHILRPDDWESLESTILSNLSVTLHLLSEAKVRATFYVLGWIAERYPDVVLQIKEQGHELGSHGYSHRLIYEQSREEFSVDVERSLRILSELAGEQVVTYRAPSYSITADTLWAWEVLRGLGIEYDSSIFPIKHDLYGIPHAPRFPFEVSLREGKLIEFPLSTVRVWKSNVPVAGGAYLRLYPLWFIRWAIRQLNRRGKPAILYFHPWELDERQPRQRVPLLTNLRHYRNIDVMPQKLRKLLAEFSFGPVCEVLGGVSLEPSWPT